jgi:Zn finger protein HypA/HybF involved in hydrogenase expression
MEGVVSSVNCWHCKTELIWGGDQDIDDEFYVMVTNLSCPKCESIVDVYYPKEKEDEDI